MSDMQALATPSRIRRRILAAAGGCVVVLIYHRVARLERDPQLLAIDPEVFESQMAMISDTFEPLSLHDLVGRLSKGRRLPRRGVAVTFDDGYADNLHHAKPALERHGIPATVFVATDRFADPSEPWWDELDRLILGPHALPEQFNLTKSGAPVSVECADCMVPAGEATSPWNLRSNPRTPRQRLYVELCDVLRDAPDSERRVILEEIRTAVDLPYGPRESHRHMTLEELVALAHGGLIDIGAHTASHQRLSKVAGPAQRAEILSGLTFLECALDRHIDLFSYPYGDMDSYTDETVRIVRDVGFIGAVSNHQSLVVRTTDPYRIPRYPAVGLDAEGLDKALHIWMGD